MKGYELLTSLYTDIEAQIIQQKLNDAGIESFLQHSESIGMFAALDSIKGINIYVEPYDLKRATELITSSFNDLTDEMEVGGEG